jgi:hypothetical protein
MARRVRFIPEGGTLVEITTRTIQGRHLLTPGPAVNEIVLGVLGRAQRLHSIPCCGICVLSSHYHLLLRVQDAEEMADFMEYVNSNLAREVGRIVDWRGPFWERRYQAIPISDEAAAQVGRLRYLLENSVKEGLVASPRDWPGIHMVQALLEGKPLKGYWFNRTREFQARCSRKEYSRLEFAEEETLVLSPLPCWVHLSEAQYRDRIEELVGQIEKDAAASRKQKQDSSLGVEAILRQAPYSRPPHLKRSPAPPFHAATKATRELMRQGYGLFLAAFREAAEKLRSGDRSARFPIGSFPPGLPFVRALPQPP